MRASIALLLLLLGSPGHAASTADGPESYTPAPWAAACAPSATLRHTPVWFRSFAPISVVGGVGDLGPAGPGLALLSLGDCSGQPRELLLTLGFCVGETWSSAEISLYLEPLYEATILGASLALRPAGSASFVALPSTLAMEGKPHLLSSAFPLLPYQDSTTGEIEALLRVLVQSPPDSCFLYGGNGVSVRSVSLGVPGG